MQSPLHPPPTIQPLHESQMEPAGATLERAFFHDPMIEFILPNSRDRSSALRFLMSLGIRVGLLFGRVLVASNPVRGVAVWVPPGTPPITPEQLTRAGFDSAQERLGEQALERFGVAMELLARLQQRCMPAPHWYLLILGVSPDQHRRGLGRALLEPVLEQADAERTPCYLETSNPANVPFYERSGFRVLAHEQLPDGPAVWAMGRLQSG
jgi:ribosomal protein S18 acetylase RimI-like enzyme